VYRYSLPLALALVLAPAAIPARAAAGAKPAQAQQGKRVWTTDDMDDLRARGLISIVGTDAGTAPAAAAPAPVTTYNSRTEDPTWYADQARELQAQLDANVAALTQARDNLAEARSNRGTTGSVNLAESNVGVTPEAGIAILEAQVLEVQSRFDELADLARRNDIAPGVLRNAAA
jgi:hypothetical protein